MKKRILSAIICLTLLFTLVACTPERPIITDNSPQVQIPTQTETPPAVNTQPENTPATTPTKPQQPTPPANQQTNTSHITKEEAKSIAFKHAGVKAGDVYDLEIEFDRDYGVDSYEIEFKSARIEYKYDIDAKTGKILEFEKDIDD